MSKPYNTPKYRGRTKVTGSVIGIIISGLLFLAIPLTQIFNDFDKNPEQIETINVAPPPRKFASADGAARSSITTHATGAAQAR